jgi:hypothetical protein
LHQQFINFAQSVFIADEVAVAAGQVDKGQHFRL